VCVLRDDGAMLSVALNASAIALLDSGVVFYRLFCTILFVLFYLYYFICDFSFVSFSSFYLCRIIHFY
jgi:hypothetical protein